MKKEKIVKWYNQYIKIEGRIYLLDNLIKIQESTK